MKQIKLLLYCLAVPVICTAQDYGNLKFGDVKEPDLSVKSYVVDTSASAVVLSDICKCSFIGNSKGFFSLVSKYYKRIHILNNNGFDAANISIHLYAEDNYEEKLDKLKAVTYNLENGKVVQTKLEKESIFSEKPDKSLVIKKFTFPNVKQGSIIELEYTTISDFINSPDGWLFQGAYPVLWSEYTFAIPSFFSYVYVRQGYLNFDIVDQKNSVGNFNVRVDDMTSGNSQSINVQAGITSFRWVVKNAPALKEEKFTSSINNHLQKIKFQLDEQLEPLTPHKYIESWPQFAAKTWELEDFGKPVTSDPGWLGDISERLVKGSTSETEKARKIYEYVRDHFTCTDYQAAWTEHSFRELEKSRGGSVAEINLFMLALLKHAGIAADPVIMSTRSHGRIFREYPLYSQFNYVIDRVMPDGKTYFLDASEPMMGFGKLPLRCYNDQARVMNSSADAVTFNANDITEKSNASVILMQNGDKLSGSYSKTGGYYESTDWRGIIKEKGKDGLAAVFRKNMGEVTLSDMKFDSLSNYEQPVAFSCQFSMPALKNDIEYINPFFGEAYDENPFKSANRYYPVEMPYAFDETYNLSFDIPEGYVVDELPKELIAKLNPQEDGIFEYRVLHKGNTISLRSRINIKKANFGAEDYNNLREFFTIIVKKQAEQIVLKKKK